VARCTRLLGRGVLAWLVVASASVAVSAGDTPRARYQIGARVSLEAPQVDGTVRVAFTNTSTRTLEEAVFVLFPNRFAAPDEGINDFNRPYVYPHEDFVPGGMELLEARDDDRVARVELLRYGDLADGMIARVRIARLLPGRTRVLTLRFRAVVPYRFGTFGLFDDQLTLNGGWYPYLASLDRDGRWSLAGAPPQADFDLQLETAQPLDLVLNGRYFSSAERLFTAAIPAVRYLSLVAAPELIREQIDADGTRITYFRRPGPLSSRISPEPSPSEQILTTVREILVRRPTGVPDPPPELVLVQAPLRLLNLTAPGEGCVLISDRALEVLFLVRPFHDLQLAQGVYGELMRPGLAPREPDADYLWVSEGLSRTLAQRFVDEQRPEARSVYDWIDLFNIFAIVDRFESAPKIPFVYAFFDKARVVDPLRAEVTTFNDPNPPGRVILGKVREQVGPESFDTIIARCTPGATPFRECSGAAAGQDLTWLYSQWLQPYPRLDYSLDAVTLNAPGGDEFRSTMTLRRESSRPIREPVTVRLRSLGGRTVDVRWEGVGDVGEVSVATPDRMWQAIIDPDRKLIEDDRGDNAYPFAPQVVLDSAEVEVSSSEFGLSALAVARNRYDYRKDLALAGFYTSRSIGFAAGPRVHWGEPIDPTRYRNNLYLFYEFQSLNKNFVDDRQPQVRTSGTLGSLGFRYDYTNVYSFDNPTDERQFRIYADWYDPGLGGDFNYVDWGYVATLTQALWSYRTIAAGQLFNGFSVPLGNSEVPNQGLYSLGGTHEIRGIPVEKELGRNTLIARFELRQDVFPEVDLNFLDLLILRRTQVRAFVDTGRVSNSAGQVYDVGAYAVGVGMGFAAIYDFMGFFPSMAYLEIATRVDEGSQAGDVQVLFGARQSF